MFLVGCTSSIELYLSFMPYAEWQQFSNELELARNGDKSTVERYVQKGTNEKMEGKSLYFAA